MYIFIEDYNNINSSAEVDTIIDLYTIKFLVEVIALNFY